MDFNRKSSSWSRYVYYIVGISLIAILGTLLTGSVLLYIQYIKTIQSLPDKVISVNHVTGSDHLFRGKLTFTEESAGNVKDVTQEVFMNDRKHEQVLHIPGEKMDIYILQKFSEGEQMAVVFNTDASKAEGSVVMCTETPLEGAYVPSKLLQHQTQDLERQLKVQEHFQPASHFLEFKYRTCADIPKNMFSKDVNSETVSEGPEATNRTKRSSMPYGGWCGDDNDGLGLPCCSGCDSDLNSCLSRTCNPVQDDVDDSCFLFKMCEACTAHQNGLPSCFCLKDFTSDLETSRCRSAAIPPAPPMPLGGGLLGGPGSLVPAVVAEGAAGAAGIATAELSPTASSAGAGQYPQDYPVPVAAAPGPVESSLVAAAKLSAEAELRSTIADIRMDSLMSGTPAGRKKRYVPLFDRHDCMAYRYRTMTELMHQRCWCPVYIRVKYVCGYQQVAGSCRATANGEKCSVKYQVCSKIMSKNTLNAVNYKKCPSIP